MSGQWRAGFNGTYALDYVPLFMRLDRLRLDEHEYEQRFQDVRVLEAAALDAMKESK